MLGAHRRDPPYSSLSILAVEDEVVVAIMIEDILADVRLLIPTVIGPS